MQTWIEVEVDGVAGRSENAATRDSKYHRISDEMRADGVEMFNPGYHLLANDLRCQHYTAETAMMAASLAMEMCGKYRCRRDEHRDADKDVDRMISMMLILRSTTTIAT